MCYCDCLQPPGCRTKGFSLWNSTDWWRNVYYSDSDESQVNNGGSWMEPAQHFLTSFNRFRWNNLAPSLRLFEPVLQPLSFQSFSFFLHQIKGMANKNNFLYTIGGNCEIFFFFFRVFHLGGGEARCQLSISLSEDKIVRFLQYCVCSMFRRFLKVYRKKE